MHLRQPYSCIVLKTFSDKLHLGHVPFQLHLFQRVVKGADTDSSFNQHVFLGVPHCHLRSIKEYAKSDAEYGADQDSRGRGRAKKMLMCFARLLILDDFNPCKF